MVKLGGFEENTRKININELTPEEIFKLYRRGELRDVDICEAWESNIINSTDVATLLRINILKVPSYCKKLLGDRVSQLAKEELESIDVSSVSQPAGGRGRKAVSGGSITPTLEVLTQIAATASAQAVEDFNFWMSIGRDIYNIAYFYAARDPRYSEGLKTDPRGTVTRFVEDAIATYVGLAEVFNRIRSIVYRLLDIIDRYDMLLRRIAPRLYPTFIAELETKAMLTLLDRLILARILGVKLGALPKFIKLWFEYEGEKLVKQQLAQIFGVPYEYLESMG